eukprot:scaffold5384_cov73-Skeletonema_dohrnii-CCMP3373.AAC.1
MPEFHEDTNFLNWLNTVKMLARATKCFDVLDPHYVLTTPAEQSAFVARFKIRCVQGSPGSLCRTGNLFSRMTMSILSYTKLMTPHSDTYVKGTLTDTLEAWEQTLTEHDTTKGVPTSPAEKKVMFNRFIQNM